MIETGSYVILSFQADRDPDGWEDEEPEGELAEMAQVRPELAAGFLRLLYLGWLLAAQTNFSEVDDEDVEPPVPVGLGDLSASLQTIVDFLGTDEELMAVAAEGRQRPAGRRRNCGGRPASAGPHGRGPESSRTGLVRASR